jgi:threonine dehydrogenase-like Zn-dependent dehydrogenase
MPKDRSEAEQNGINVIIDCTGSPKALEAAIPFTARGAKILIFGCAPMGQTMQ